MSSTCSILIYIGARVKQLSANTDHSSRICFFHESDECFAGHEFAEPIGFWWWPAVGCVLWKGCEQIYTVYHWHRLVTCPDSFKVSPVWMFVYPYQERMECHKTFQDLCMLHFGEADIPLSLAG